MEHALRGEGVRGEPAVGHELQHVDHQAVRLLQVCAVGARGEHGLDDEPAVHHAPAHVPLLGRALGVVDGAQEDHIRPVFLAAPVALKAQVPGVGLRPERPHREGREGVMDDVRVAVLCFNHLPLGKGDVPVPARGADIHDELEDGVGRAAHAHHGLVVRDAHLLAGRQAGLLEEAEPILHFLQLPFLFSNAPSESIRGS
mmetsp:Transcript_20380/g.34147  ORF Transcript_20380/g.34147 Transcript_20380/m.34147 type:complete len:200 (+) Transcript_20380:1095-1694(+)